MLENTTAGAAQIGFTMDLEAYSNEVAQLLLECRKLQQEEEAFRERIVAFENERAQLHIEMEIAAKAAVEFQKDFTHATKLEREIECPICGARYENRIAERFRIVQDEIICEDLHATLATYCPVVVDAINQQDQSRDNLARMYHELANGLPSGTQLILGCVDTYGVKFNGETVRLNEKRGLLTPRDYDENIELVRRLLDARFSYERSLDNKETA